MILVFCMQPSKIINQFKSNAFSIKIAIIIVALLLTKLRHYAKIEATKNNLYEVDNEGN